MSPSHPDDLAFLLHLRQHLAADEPEPSDAERKVLGELVDEVLPFVVPADEVNAAPAWDLLPLGRPAADLVPVTGSPGRAVVVCDTQLLAVAHLVSVALAAALPAKVEGDRLQLLLDDEGWEALLTRDHPAVQTFVDAIVAVHTNDGAEAAEAAIDERRDAIVSTLQQVIAWFELAVPYAHAAAGHVESAERRSWLEGEVAVERFEWSAEEDQDAVARAVFAVLHRGRQAFGDLRMVVWALDAWLTTAMLVAAGPAVIHGLGQDVFERLVERPAERRGLLRAMLERDDELRPALAVAAALEPIMQQFWEHAIDALVGASEGDADTVM